MNEEIRTLIESLRRGQYEDPAAKIELLSAALLEHEADTPLLLSLLRAPQISLRLAATAACRGRTELAPDLIKLAADPEARVRKKLAEILDKADDKLQLDALRALAQDSEEAVRLAAVKSSSGRSDFRELQESLLENDPNWEVRLAAAQALGEQNNPTVVKALLKAVANDSDSDVTRRCAEWIEKRLVNTRLGAEKHLPTEIGLLGKAESELKNIGGQRFPQLLGWITARTTVAVDPKALAAYGTDLTAMAESGTLPRAHCLDAECETVLKLIRREPWRSIAVLGTTGTGKSALVNQLVYELAKPENGRWRVLRISPTDFMAGTKFLGEWETKVRELVEAVKKPRRVIIYVPNLSDLSTAGTWSRSEMSVATALGPYLEEGNVLLLGESTPEEFERGIGRILSLQRLFDRVQVVEADEARTCNILAAVRDEEKLPVNDSVLSQLQEISGQFLSHVSRPGNAVGLLRSVIQHARESDRQVGFRDVLDSLSKSSGIPADLLDDNIPLRHEEVKAFFERKIIGQAEAVDSVVDLVALIKSGLADPQKPFGVFLFVGPTGVGKTELARALAEFIFGDAARLKRFDMSEFASADSHTRLIGARNENGLLTDAVRHHPFSVVLLDEIEKSHLNVFDLCLQIFDAGRLTDGRGRTVDFRRTIVILTSNIGATAPGTPLGFAANGDLRAAEVDKDRTFRELTRFFRPEFLNRLDRIVQFRPLSLEVAEQIARREVDLVLQRSGIRRRGLTIEVDTSVISLLVREGYSAHFGARPLKRTIEHLLLAPLARAISSGKASGARILHLTQRDGRIRVSAAAAAQPEPLRVAVANRTKGSLLQETEELLREFAALEEILRPLVDRKSELLQRTQERGFYRDAVIRATTFDEIRKLDQFLALRTGLGKGLQTLNQKVGQKAWREVDGPATRERIDHLRAELRQLRFVAGCKDARDLGDVLVILSLVERIGGPQNGVETLAGMYQGLARHHRMTAEIMGERYDDKHDRAYLLISGLGAFALLEKESGLHRLHRRFREKTPRSGREATREDREIVRVETLPAGSEPDKAFQRALNTRVLPLKPVRSRLLNKANLAVSLFHEPSLRSLELWMTGPKESALERAVAVLHAQVTSLLPAEQDAASTVVRHYDLGLSPGIKDLRSGKATTRVDRVLKGQLDLLTSPPP
jgi:ATP-dependent Clp protease ATP-binding subunit ClpA/protein subunit release factor A